VRTGEAPLLYTNIKIYHRVSLNITDFIASKYQAQHFQQKHLQKRQIVFKESGPVIQCCGSRRFLTGSGSDFRKRPDPDPDLNKFSLNLFLEIFLVKICSKKYLHGPKS
jgi:hypothetical protein